MGDVKCLKIMFNNYLGFLFLFVVGERFCGGWVFYGFFCCFFSVGGGCQVLKDNVQ